MAKEWAKKFYNSAQWQQTRLLVLRRDRYICQTQGCHRTAEEVHHKVELTKDNIHDINISLNPENLISLCGDCHKTITKQMKRKCNTVLEDIIFDEDGYPIVEEKSPRGVKLK